MLSLLSMLQKDGIKRMHFSFLGLIVFRIHMVARQHLPAASQSASLPWSTNPEPCIVVITVQRYVMANIQSCDLSQRPLVSFGSVQPHALPSEQSRPP